MAAKSMLVWIVVFLSCSCVFAAEEYPLIWRFEKGLLIVFQQKFTIKKELFLVDKETKQVQRPLEQSGLIALEFSVYWQVAEVLDKQKAVVTYIFRNGKITIQQGAQTHVCEVENPAHADKLKQPMFKPYLSQVRNGFVFIIHFAGPKPGYVEATWLLEEAQLSEKKKDKDKEILDYIKKKVPGRRDPFQMEVAFWQLPNKMVKIGDKWTRKGVEEMRTFEQTLTLSKIEKYRGETTARVDFGGTATNISDGKPSGTTKAHYLFNLERRVMMYNDWTGIYENYYPYQKKANEKSRELLILERLTQTNEMSLVNSSASKEKK
jgi:hypothetical protein